MYESELSIFRENLNCLWHDFCTYVIYRVKLRNWYTQLDDTFEMVSNKFLNQKVLYGHVNMITYRPETIHCAALKMHISREKNYFSNVLELQEDFQNYCYIFFGNVSTVNYVNWNSYNVTNLCNTMNMNSMKTCASVTFYFMKISFSDIDRKWILPNMIKMWWKDKFSWNSCVVLGNHKK